MNRLALFDCDGTLVDSQANICLAMEHAFDAVGLPPPGRHRIRRIVGLSLVEAVADLLPDAEPAMHAAIADDYKAHFFRLRASGAMAAEPMFDGIADLLDTLAARGWMLGVATGKSDRGLNHVLAHHGIAHHFVTLQTADRHPSKPHPSMVETAMADAGASPATTIVIGDTSFDMAMAINAGTTGIGVDWGYHDREELIAAGAIRVAEHAGEIATWLDNL